MEHFYDRLTDTVARDFVSLFLGKKIGFGVGRHVYENRLDPTTVVKIEENGGSFQNVLEATLWEEVCSYKPIAKWFAPVVAISPCGTVFVQKKVERLYKKDYPTHLPAFLTDIKEDNFGRLNGRVVCFDYGFPRLSQGFTKRLKKVKF